MELARVESGPADGPPLVLLHGFPFDHSIWDHQRAELSDRRRVVALDLRGHGRSATAETDFAIDRQADDVLETLDTIGLTGPVALGGLSMGGYVALSIAARHPERLRALLLIDTRAAADAPEAAANRLALASRLEAEGSAEPVAQAFLPRLFGPLTHQRNPGAVEAVGRLIRATPLATLAGCLRAMAARPDRTADLATIRIPTLVVAGEHDVITTPEEARGMAEALPLGRLAIIPEAGHLTCLENPEAATGVLHAFLDDIDA
jgi:pimeloyl-ACP methyl ester carboxylesterase